MSVEKIELQNNVNSITVPDFIYNRFDLYADKTYICVCEKKGEQYGIPVHRQGSNVELGLWLAHIPQEIIEEVCGFIFANDSGIQTITYQNSLIEYKDAKMGNHFSIQFPDSIEDLKARLSSKGRYNIQREKRIINDTFNGYTIEEYTPDNIPESIFDEYFRMKEITHGINYNMTAKTYIDKYHVSNIYVLNTQQRILAILLSCEQCPVVYIENLTYDVEFSKYSPGQVLYDIYLETLIKKGKKVLFLAGGDLDYKRRYGSEENDVYSGIFYRNEKVKNRLERERKSRIFIEKIYSRIPESIKNIYRKIK